MKSKSLHELFRYTETVLFRVYLGAECGALVPGYLALVNVCCAVQEGHCDIIMVFGKYSRCVESLDTKLESSLICLPGVMFFSSNLFGSISGS